MEPRPYEEGATVLGGVNYNRLLISARVSCYQTPCGGQFCLSATMASGILD